MASKGERRGDRSRGKSRSASALGLRIGITIRFGSAIRFLIQGGCPAIPVHREPQSSSDQRCQKQGENGGKYQRSHGRSLPAPPSRANLGAEPRRTREE